jgi:uncharacterized protein (DUF58 family)
MNEQSKELIAEIRKIEIYTKRLVNQQMAGQYHSVFKGRGMSFDEVRIYSPGDDPRTIDWNVTARTGTPHVKVYTEERELTVMLVMDMSGNMAFGTKNDLKNRVAAKLAAMVALSAIKNGDRVGLICFADGVSQYVPPKKGKLHVLRIIDEILRFKGDRKMANIGEALEFTNRVMKRKSVVFMISDFLADDFDKALNLTAQRHDFIPLVLTDPAEEKMQSCGLMAIEDLATAEISFFDFGTQGAKLYEEAQKKRKQRLETLFKRSGLSHIAVSTDAKDYATPLMNYFRIRAKRA